MAMAFTALGVVATSCVTTSGLAGGPEPTTDASADTSPVNPNPCGKDLPNDPGNCGTCGNACSFGANSFPLCTAGVCKIGCNTQYGNCDNNDKNGCESILAGDPLNCNACGRDCGGGKCSAGQCGPVSLTPKVDAGQADGFPLSLGQDATSLFYGWRSNTNSTYDLVKLDKATGAVLVLASDPTYYYAEFLTADADPNGFVYFGRSYTQLFPIGGPYTSADGAVLKVSKMGGPSAVSIFAGTALGTAGGLFVDSNTRIVATATGIFFSVFGFSPTIGGGVFKCPVTGTCPSPVQLAASGNQYGIISLAVDETAFAFNNAQTAAVYTCPLAGCPDSPTQVQATTSARLMFEDAANYYWINQYNSSIVKVDRGTNVATVLASGQTNPYGLAIDDKNVYWTNAGSSGNVSACAIALADGGAGSGCGGNPSLLAQNVNQPYSVVVDAKAVYWSTQISGGGIFKLVK